MKNIKFIIGLFLFATVILNSCTEDTFVMGDLIAPSNIVINTNIVGQSDTTPDGDGSGEVIINVTANDAFVYHIGYNKLGDYGDVNFSILPGGAVNKKFTDPGTTTYRISVVAFGAGGASSNLTKDITVRSDFVPNAEIVTALTNDDSKTWVVDGSLPGHLGVAPWDPTVDSPIWWGAGPNEKADCCNCFYTATFTFSSNAGNYSLVVDSPDGAFTKTGDLAGGLPGIPESGDEGCYDYAGGSSTFNFVHASSGVATGTHTAIALAGSDTYIGYGAVQKEYEFLEITPSFIHLRVQGTETGNSWYIKLKPAE